MVVDAARRLGHPPADRRRPPRRAARDPPAGARPPSPARRRRRTGSRPRRGPPPTRAPAGRSRRGRATSPSGGTARTRCRAAASPARRASAIPSPVTAGGFDVDAKTWPKPPEAITTARAVTMPTDTTCPSLVEHGDAHPGGLARTVGPCAEHEVERERRGSSTSTPAPIADSSSVRCTSAPRLVAAGVDDAVVAVAALAGRARRCRLAAIVWRRDRTPRRAASGSGSTSAPRPPARARPPRRTARRLLRACRARGSRACRSGRARRRGRPGPTGSTRPTGCPWSRPARCAPGGLPARPTALPRRSRARRHRRRVVQVARWRGELRSARLIGSGRSRSLGRRRRGADGDHPLDRQPGPIGDVASST